MISITTQYLPNAGLFDPQFTPKDITFVVIIFLAWSIRMYMERANKTVANPKLEDYIFSLVIAYATTGAIYQYCIHRNWPIGVVMFPMLIVAILSLSFIRWLFSVEGKKKTGEAFSGIIDFLMNMLQNFKNKGNE